MKVCSLISRNPKHPLLPPFLRGCNRATVYPVFRRLATLPSSELSLRKYIPCTADLLTTSSMQLALLVQPMALPHPSEDPIQVLDFGESGHVRCSRCKGYINPFMKFID
ncbi:hypothetical protein ES332_D02G097600v1 [Gossypium tomentosum]|uniref:Zinc finger Sec23/Sec24-type domain-containing protein n=1 Tax=Gossypium tomentosum TaxID=34277 RepID=A0A5D2LV63_GOSTO|nr:hypothetical protein ES332_D02G097600v1 [Gossypium tomentosum]